MAMRREDNSQVKVSVGIEVLWRALTKNLNSILPTILPKLIKEVEILQGDGTLGTVYVFKFCPDVPKMRDQMEKVVEFDESLHLFGLQVIEGGRLNLGFNFIKAIFKLTAEGDSETLVEIELNVDFETECKETSEPAGDVMESAVAFVRSLETFLVKQEIPGS